MIFVSTDRWFTVTHISNTMFWLWFKLPCVLNCFKGIQIFLHLALLEFCWCRSAPGSNRKRQSQTTSAFSRQTALSLSFIMWTFSPLCPLGGHLSHSSFNDSVCTLFDTEAEKMRSHRSQTDSRWSSRKPPIWNFNSHFEKRKSSYNEAGCCFQWMSTVHHLWGRFPQQQLQPHTELGVITESVCRNVSLSISVARWCYGANYDQVH